LLASFSRSLVEGLAAINFAAPHFGSVPHYRAPGVASAVCRSVVAVCAATQAQYAVRMAKRAPLPMRTAVRRRGNRLRG